MSSSRWTDADYQRQQAKFRTPTGLEVLRIQTHPDQGNFTVSAAPAKRQKFNAQPTVTLGRKFASKKEARRYHELLLRLKAGEIRRLECQPVYVMHTENSYGEWIACGKFTPDFRYLEASDEPFADTFLRSWHEVIEDVKGGKATRTEAYMLRKKHVEAEYGVTIHEV